MRPEHLPTFPHSLHPGAWWLWAIGLTAASRTQNPVPLLMIVAVTGFVVAARRGDAPWARSYVAFLKLSLVVIAMRILFQSLNLYRPGWGFNVPGYHQPVMASS